MIVYISPTNYLLFNNTINNKHLQIKDQLSTETFCKLQTQFLKQKSIIILKANLK